MEVEVKIQNQIRALKQLKGKTGVNLTHVDAKIIVLEKKLKIISHNKWLAQ